LSKKQNGPRLNHAGRPVDCLGLTKRWSLYVAPSANSGSRRNLRRVDQP